MSYQDFRNAMCLAPQCKFYTTVGGKTKKEIKKSEKILNIKFSKQCLEFYENYGYMSFFGNEIFGIDPNDDSGILEGNSVAYTVNDRNKYNLPIKWIPIYNFENGCMAYLDYSSLNSEKEPRVIMAFYNGDEYVISDVLAEDFGEFLLRLVKEQLNSQKE